MQVFSTYNLSLRGSDLHSNDLEVVPWILFAELLWFWFHYHWRVVSPEITAARCCTEDESCYPRLNCHSYWSYHLHYPCLVMDFMRSWPSATTTLTSLSTTTKHTINLELIAQIVDIAFANSVLTCEHLQRDVSKVAVIAEYDQYQDGITTDSHLWVLGWFVALRYMLFCSAWYQDNIHQQTDAILVTLFHT